MSDPARQHHLAALIDEALFPTEPVPTVAEARLSHLPGIRWVVFDIYGTLLTSAAGEIGTSSSRRHTDHAFQSVFSWYRARFPGYYRDVPDETVWADTFFELIRKEHATLRSGRAPQPEVDIREIWLKLLKSGGLLSHLSDVEAYNLAEEAALRFELALNPVWPMPGADSILALLRRHSFHQGIISNAQFYTPLIIEALFGQSPEELGFTVTTWSYQERIAKPSGSLFRTFLNRAKATDSLLDEREILYIGNDIRNDIAPARQIGFHTALFAGDARSLRLRKDDPEMAGVIPDVVLTELEQLKHVLFPEGTGIVDEEIPPKGSSS